MPIGTVKWFSDQKGFGFITPDGAAERERDMFVHISAVKAAGLTTLAEGQRLEFAVGDNKGKPVAIDLVAAD